MKKSGVIALVGGGTGGHIFPLVAIGEEFQARRRKFIYIGSPKSLEEKVITALRWEFVAIDAGKLRRYVSAESLLQNFLDIFRAIGGFFQAVRVFKRYGVSLVVSKGGFVALPVLYAARIMGVPVIVHESDCVMGLSNRIGSKFAKKVLTAFDPSVFPGADSRYRKVGIPIRKSLRQAAGLRSPKKNRPLVLVLPGSQGSVAINLYLKESLLKLLNHCDIVHLSGEQDFPAFEQLGKRLPKELSGRYRTYRFIDRELSYYYQSADLIIVRASATTAAEAALFNKPLYMIPLPNSANNHQQENARRLASVGAAMVRQQYQLSAEQFQEDIITLLNDEQRLSEMGAKLSEHFHSAEAVNKFIEEIDHAAL